MTDFTEQKCVACEGGIPAMTNEEIKLHLTQLNDWLYQADIPALEKKFHFKNFYQTMAFVNAVAWIANQENHHPDIELGYHYCQIRYQTHAVKGITTNDFICAAKIDRLNS